MHFTSQSPEGVLGDPGHIIGESLYPNEEPLADVSPFAEEDLH